MESIDSINWLLGKVSTLRRDPLNQHQLEKLFCFLRKRVKASDESSEAANAALLFLQKGVEELQNAAGQESVTKFETGLMWATKSVFSRKRK